MHEFKIRQKKLVNVGKTRAPRIRVKNEKTSPTL